MPVIQTFKRAYFVTYWHSCYNECAFMLAELEDEKKQVKFNKDKFVSNHTDIKMIKFACTCTSYENHFYIPSKQKILLYNL